ncbi:SDR family NAD(P)-dependent oxidoreductase [Streptomyces sp. NPDC053048]|uniref:SDR family NAD(P)-dependent oxidoreductase n=1 Tax=Streptomyces sp. NPDC053048 TaxID=3365694 RepID=UPI0037CE3393
MAPSSVEHLRSEPIAVVGAACRLPGGISTPAELWSALISGRDLIGPVPPGRFDPDRWLDPDPGRPGKTYTTVGGFLDDIHGFDAGYFAMSPREVSRMDPQQRLALELAVEALDDAGVAAAVLAGADTAVYMGVSSPAFGVMQGLDERSTDGYTMTGGALSIVANRVSHFLDLRGPSLAIDTACSSSLVALHHACEALRAGRCGTALAGGVHVLLSPFEFVGFSKASMLSPTGRCRTFSAGADGYVRAEGGGVVLLKPLSRALADGDRVHAVILGSAVNTDGRTPGLAQPSADAQEAVLRAAYEAAGVEPDEVAYLEMHGTGTPVGDPTECRAVTRALGARRRPGSALAVGSVKSHLGHLEPASGMAGLFTTMLVLRHGRIPANRHALPLNPAIDFAGWGLAPAVATRPLDSSPTGRTVAGVNSFGFGGANAHVVLTACDPPAPEPASGKLLPLIVSGRTPAAAGAAARRMAERLAGCDEREFYDLAWTSCRRRGLHEHRVAVLADGPAEAAGLLRGPHPGPVPAAGRAEVAMVYSGNGSQWAGMGADLLAAEPVFRAAVRDADDALRPHLGWSVLEELATPQDRRRPDTTDVAQPLLFAVQVGLTALLERHGIRPGGVVGHSSGETAAAWAAGALGLDAAARVVVERSRAQASTAGDWGMAAIGAGAERAERLLAPYAGRLEIAAVNSGRDVTVSGDRAALAALGAELLGAGVFFRDLGLPYGFHSHAMDGLRQRLPAVLAGLKGQPAHTAYASATTGTLLDGPELDAGYWWRNVRQPVLFAAAVGQLLSLGCDLFLEVGPHPVLGGCLRRCAPAAQVLSTLSRGVAGPEAVRSCAGQLLAAGVASDAYFPRPGRVVDLPAYPWERERHWNGGPAVWTRTCGDGTAAHPLLGERAAVAEPTWHGPFEPARVPWLAGHVIAGAVIMPATGYVEMALAAGRRLWDAAVEITDLAIPHALVLPFEDHRRLEIQTALSADDGVVRVAGRGGGSGPWLEHARGRARRLLDPRPDPVDTGRLAAELEGRCTAEDFYRLIERAGVRYGPDFLVLDNDLLIGDDRVLTRYTTDAALEGYEAHPALLDGAVQTGLMLLEDLVVEGVPYLPAAVDRVRAWSRLPAAGHFLAHRRAMSEQEALLDLTVLGADGQVCLFLEGVRLRKFGAQAHRYPSLHRTVLRAAARPGHDPGPVPLPGTLEPARACGAPPRGDRLEDGGDHRARVRDAARELAGHFGAATMVSILPDGGAGGFGVGDLLDAGVRPQYAPLLRVLLEAARTCGLAEPESGSARWRIVRPPAPEERFRDLARRYPGLGVELALLGTCGAHLAEVLCGSLDPAGLLLTEANRSLLEEFHTGAFPARAVGAAVRVLVAAWPDDRPLRVLEVGAGTGALTAAVLPLLPPERTQYAYTDVSDSYFVRARKRFAAYDFVTYKLLATGEDPVEQGFAEGGFDLVLAGDSLHAAADLRVALAGVGRLLADGGHLLAFESHDLLVFALLPGLLPSFWHRTDPDLRPGGPLLDADAWRRVLAGAGFREVTAVEVDDASSVLLARRPPKAEPVARTPGVPEPATAWIVAAEPSCGALATALARRLGAGAVEVAIDSNPGRWQALLGGASGPAGVVLLMSSTDSRLDVDRAVRRIAVLRALARTETAATVQVWLVTPPTGALPAPERPLAPELATVWGAARCLANEQPRFDVRRVSLDSGGDPAADAERLAAEIVAPDAEDEIVLTRGGRFVPRVHARPGPALGAQAGADESFALRLRDPGGAYRLSWVPAGIPRPGPQDVLVSVRAAALNFHDIMQARGLIPLKQRTDGPGHAVGLEGTGVVTGVGSAVTGFATGDRVFVFGTDTLRSHTTVHQTMVWRIPDGMGFHEAATLAAVHVTVHHALHHLARLAAGEAVLVHGAAGGVGLAALQYAQHVGARVIATAGTPAKRDLLRLLGVRHVLDSRTLDFAHQVKSLTGGRGVDVVLNSLAGEAISRGLESLRTGGRFIELGKRDIYGNSRLLLRPFLDHLTLSAVGDVTELLTHQPELAAREGADIKRLVGDGVYRPILHHVHPADRITDAFEALQHSRHIGKVVISLDPPPHLETTPPPVTLDDRGTYLVTGGLDGFGAATARWLARQGARRLALVGRRGEHTPGAPALLDELRGYGAGVSVHAADVSDAAALRAVLASLDAPLRGVVHAATVYDDGPLTELTDDRIRDVLAAKAGGAALLDELTRDSDPRLFLLYSSVTALFGNPRQSNYVAANLYLEALARARRRDRRAALAVGWGAVADTGHAARTDMSAYLRAMGLPPSPTRELLRSLGPLLGGPYDVAVPAGVDWSRARHAGPATGRPRFAGLVPEQGGDEDGEALARALADATPEAALALVTEALTGHIARTLQTTADRLPPDRPLAQLGLDSLMGAELTTVIHRQLGCDLPMVEIVSSASIGDLAQRCVHRMKRSTG